MSVSSGLLLDSASTQVWNRLHYFLARSPSYSRAVAHRWFPICCLLDHPATLTHVEITRIEVVGNQEVTVGLAFEVLSRHSEGTFLSLLVIDHAVRI